MSIPTPAPNVTIIPSRGAWKKWYFAAVPILVLAAASTSTAVWGSSGARRVLVDISISAGIFLFLALCRTLFKAYEAWAYIGCLPTFDKELKNLYYPEPATISNLLTGGQLSWGYVLQSSEATPLCKWLAKSVLYSMIYPRNDRDDVPMSPG